MENMRRKLSLKDEGTILFVDESAHIVFVIYCYFVYIPDVRGLENDFQLQPILDDEDNNRFIIVQFNVETNATKLPKNIAYTLRVRHNGLQTHTQYLKAVHDSYFKPGHYAYLDFPYRNSGFLAVKLALDTALVEISEPSRPTDFEVSVF
jgi:hypothetical protein